MRDNETHEKDENSLEHLAHEVAEKTSMGINALHLTTHHVPHIAERVAFGAELASNLVGSKEQNIVKRSVCATVKTAVGEFGQGAIVAACGQALRSRFPAISTMQKIGVSVGLSTTGTPLLNSSFRLTENLAEDVCNFVLDSLETTETRAENGEREENFDKHRIDVIGNDSVILLTRDPLITQINTMEVNREIIKLQTQTSFNLFSKSNAANTSDAIVSLNNRKPNSAVATINTQLQAIAHEAKNITTHLKETTSRADLNFSSALDKQNYNQWGSGAPRYYSGPASLFSINEAYSLNNYLSEPPSLLNPQREAGKGESVGRGKKYEYGPGGFTIS